MDDDTHPPDNINTSTFLEVPSEAQVKQCYEQFYKATTPASLALDVCAVCAAEVNQLEDDVSKLRLYDIPNIDRLQPNNHHDAVVLFDGLVLEPAGVEERGDELMVTICGRCLKEMAKSNPDPP